MVNQICIHQWIVSSWRISEHSKEAQELMCQKCAAFVSHPELHQLRITYAPQQVPRGALSDSTNLVSPDRV